MDIRSVDLNLLVALDVLIAERNVTRAATRLHLSQSAMSATLARLRTLFKDPLLLRTSGGMLPTSKALALAAPVKQVLADIGHLVRQPDGFDAATAQVTFTIAASDYIEYAILPRLVDFLEANAPHVTLAVRPMDFGAVGRQLESGEVDLGILAAGFAPPNVRSRPLYLERFVVLARKDHPRVRGEITLDEFCEIDHLSVWPSGRAFTGHTDEALAAIGRRRRVRLSVPHFLLVPEILARSDMIAVLPERLARDYRERFHVMDVPLALAPFMLVEIWHDRTHRDPALAWLRQTLAELMGDGTTAVAAQPLHGAAPNARKIGAAARQRSS